MTTKIKKPTVEQIAQRMNDDFARKDLERKARALAARIKAVDDQTAAYLEQAGKDEMKFGAHSASIVEVAGRVSWKDELIAIWPPEKPLPEAEPTTRLVFV